MIRGIIMITVGSKRKIEKEKNQVSWLAKTQVLEF
jgi:hypothetical protein